MNPLPTVPPGPVARIPQRGADRRRDPQAGQQFRQALAGRQQDPAGDAGPARDDGSGAPASDGRAADGQAPDGRAPAGSAAERDAPGIARFAGPPTARGLQRALAGGRRDQEHPPHHVDVLA